MLYEQEVGELLHETESIIGFMQEALPPDNPVLISARLSEINVYLARSAFILSQAEYYKECQSERICDTLDKNLKATEVRRILAAATKDTALLIRRAEVINKDLVNQGNNLRKQLGYIIQTMAKDI